MIREHAISKRSAYDFSLALAIYLAPYTDNTARDQQTLPYRLIRRLMNNEVISSWIGLDLTPSWYQQLEGYYKENARFWEQRALAESKRGQLDKAESYAVTAITRHRDSFTANTLGTILMKKAIEWVDPTSGAALDYYWSGVDTLRESVSLRSTNQYPYITFFEYTMRYVDAHFVGTITSEQFRREWRRWYDSARFAPPFAHLALSNQLASYMEKWLMKNAVPKEIE